MGDFKKKTVTLLALLLLTGVVLSSGCVEKLLKVTSDFTSGECGKIESKLEERGVQCDCYRTDLVPDKLKNMSNVTGKCYCTCESGGKQYNISILQTPGNGTKFVK